MKAVFPPNHFFVALSGMLVAMAVAFFLMNEKGGSETVTDRDDGYLAPLLEQPLEIRSLERSSLPAFDKPRMVEENPIQQVSSQGAISRTEPSSMDHQKLIEKFGSKEEVSQMRESFNETVEEKGLMDSERGVSDHLEQVFEEEPVDGLWAYDYETALYEVFANDEILSGTPIKSIECRSVRCRIDVDIRSPDAMMEVYKRLQTAVIQGDEGLNYATFLGNYSVESGIATWYLGRDKTVDLLGDVSTP
ncbi:hypothetical protein OOT55_13940 [Marinimicrobium sp. C6131]|uniref:hypothetical protein n=1 Tax=Marinimicrobium sp. C6131 TaxID=3022676 RepID=UPI00223CE05D|nr:hypothetical protein [Marinimicrobium sp. C6131]UZJ43749.1 hypothetical protein OOT55_13940 [Marinimicrobium sp. C6131]